MLLYYCIDRTVMIRTIVHKRQVLHKRQAVADFIWNISWVSKYVSQLYTCILKILYDGIFVDPTVFQVKKCVLKI